MHLPILPLQFISIELKADTLGLDDVQGLDIISGSELLLVLFHKIGKEVKGLEGRRDPWSTCRGK